MSRRVMKHSGRERWERPVELLREGEGDEDPAAIQRAVEQAERRRRAEETERAAIHAAPCRRCRAKNTDKSYFVGMRDVCRSCQEIVIMVGAIEACGGMNQTADSLAENLVGIGVLTGEE